MKNRMMLLIGLILGILRVNAQEKKNRAMMMTDRLDSQVTLSGEQREKVYELNKKFAMEMREMRKDQNESNHEEMHSLHQKHRAEMEELLTLEQKNRLKEQKDARVEHHKAMHKELRDYHKTNIHPVMVQKRKEFENKLTADEKRIIAETRMEIRRLRKDMIAEMKDMSSEQRRAGMRYNPKRQEIKNAMDSRLGPVVHAHREDLDLIHTELAPQRELWEKDLEVIREKHNDTLTQQRNSPKKGAAKGNKRGKDSESRQSGKQFNQHRDFQFLLLDPQKSEPEEEPED